LVAEWSIDRQRDHNKFDWFGTNVEANIGIDLPHHPSIGISIPKKFIPVWEEHRLNVENVRKFEQVGQVEQKSGEASLTEARRGYAILRECVSRLQAPTAETAKAALYFESARNLGLSDRDYACALGSIGLVYIHFAKDIPHAFECCQRGVKIAPEAYWQSSFILSLVHEGLGRVEDSNRLMTDAKRFALTRWWEADVEQQLRAITKHWFATHSKEEVLEKD
jgi:hypothetical protein